MSSSNPILPEGSVQELDQEKMKTRIWIIGIIAVHICVIFVLLIQGCTSESPGSKNTNVAKLNGNGSGSDESPSLTDLPKKSANSGQGSNDQYYGENANLPEKTKPSGSPLPVGSPGSSVSGDTSGSGQARQASGGGEEGGGTSGDSSSGNQASPSGGTTYTIKSGDRFQSIANEFDVSIQAILDANPGVNPRKLQVGQEITIPDSSETKTSQESSTEETTGGDSDQYRMYEVKKGDSLWSIKEKTGVSVEKIRELNDLSSNRIDPGQKLKLPK